MPEFDFGHFHIIDELGRGGMALVYRAIDTRSDETVALKILYPHLMSDENTIKRFQREAKVATRLKHKYIVPVVDFGECDDQIYIAMKYMPGNSLNELFIEPRSVPIKALIRILGEVASALDYAHGHGVIHRDLKLQNILLDDERHAHLADFGIAHLVDGTRLTATGQIAGTPMYMSPEQIRGKPLDFRSDIYSFSVMSYLLLTGFYPFTGEDSLAVIHKHVKEFPPTPTDVNPDLPETINTVLLRGLMKDPADRYESTLDMVKALHRAVNTPDYHDTTTRIDIHAINPVDSIEMDAMPMVADSRVLAPNAVDSRTGQTSQSSAQTKELSGKHPTQNVLNGSRSQKIILGILAAVAVIAFALSGLDNDGFEVAETRRYIAVDVETQMCSDISEEYDANGVMREHEVERIFDCTGDVQTSNGTTLRDKPGPDRMTNEITRLANDTRLYIIGRDEFGAFLQVVTQEENRRGWVRTTDIRTPININDLPQTTPPQEEDGNGPNDGQQPPRPPEGQNSGNPPPRPGG